MMPAMLQPCAGLGPVAGACCRCLLKKSVRVDDGLDPESPLESLGAADTQTKPATLRIECSVIIDAKTW